MTIQYSLASVWERGIALLIDLIVMGIVYLFLWGLQNLLFPSSFELMLYFILFPFVLFYSLAFEQLNNGQSLGKKILNIRVIRMDGKRTFFLDYLMRWMFRCLDIYSSFGGIAILSVVSSNYNQRVGDLLANTVVVNIGKIERLRLENLLKLNKLGEYKVTYPQVIKMPEEAMIIVKETLGKHKKFNNSAHNNALELLVQKLEAELNVKAPSDNELFLKTLLKDYIVLTR